jgi:hypothetical protein
VSIEVDDAKFRRIVEVVGSAAIPFEELAAIGRLLQLAASIDLADDPDERALLDALLGHLRSLGGLDVLPELPYIPTDAEERASVAARLASGIASTTARELAYALAYLIVAADAELAPVESSFLEELRTAFGISADRASELAEQAAEIATPPE